MEKNKKVAVIYSGAKYWGGIETYLVNLFAAKSDIDLVLLSMGKWPLSQKIEKSGCQVQYLSGKRFSLRTIFVIKKYCAENGITLVAAGGLVASSYARAVSFLSNIPCVVTVHSLQELDYPNVFLNFAYNIANRASRWKTTKYIAVSKYVKDSLVKSGISSKKIKVIYNGVEDIGAKPKKRTGKIVIGSVGRLHHVKGYHNLIRALEILDDENVTLKIWGDGPEREELKDFVKRYHLGDRVELLGYTDNVANVFSEIDIYVQPSLMEGFGLTVVEAMFAEKPIVVTPAGSLPELITDGKTGFVSHGTQAEVIAASLRALIDNKSTAELFGKAARKDALDRFGLERFQEETLEVFIYS